MAAIQLLDKWNRGESWEAVPLSEEAKDVFYSKIIKYDSGWESFRDQLDYLIINTGKTPPVRYDPFIEAPEAYLSFCQLAECQHYQSSPKACLQAILKFFHNYGSLWGEKDNPPYTVINIIRAACRINSTVKMYQLLTQTQREIRHIPQLEKYLLALKEAEVAGSTDILYRHTGGYTYSDWPQEKTMVFPPTAHKLKKTPSLPIIFKDNKAVFEAAIAYILSEINLNLRYSTVHLALSNKLKRDLNSQEIEPGGWIQVFKYRRLEDVLWLQFYQSILTGRANWKQCANDYCQRLFEPVRSDQKFCTKGCKDAYNMRKLYRNR